MQYLTCDIGVLAERNAVFADTMHVPGFKEQMKQWISGLGAFADMVKLQNSISDSERGLYSVKDFTYGISFEKLIHAPTEK